MWNEIRTAAEHDATATHFRVFPGEGAHSDALADLVRQLDKIGYFGDYSFDVYNDDYLQVARRNRCRPGAARRGLAWRDRSPPRAAGPQRRAVAQQPVSGGRAACSTPIDARRPKSPGRRSCCGARNPSPPLSPGREMTSRRYKEAAA